MQTLNIAFYRFVDLENESHYRPFFQSLCQKLGLKGKIILSPEGINGSLAGPPEQIREFQEALLVDPFWQLHPLEYKESLSDRPPFRRMLVKLKTEVVPLGDLSIRPAQQTGERISAQEFKKWMDEKKEMIVLDTRNDYETELGTFEGALDLHLKCFRDLPERLQQLPTEMRSKPMVMYCTGGIRCEKASVVALRAGFSEVYQLEGGILKYFEECGGKYFDGQCFVFDDRVAVDSELQPLQS